MNTQIMRAVADGNLLALSPAQRVEYYEATCASMGLNPLTRPFGYILFEEKKKDGTVERRLELYARADLSAQLRKLHGVSVEREEHRLEAGGDIYVHTVYLRDRDGRTDIGTGAVPLVGYEGKTYAPTMLANAYMRAETKAKRRGTLSLCGLSILDESELDSLSGARLVSAAATPTADPETGELAHPPTPGPTAGGNGGNGPGIGPNEWLGQHARVIFACKRAHPYLQPLQIAERLSTLGVDPVGGEAAALAALAREAPPSTPEPPTAAPATPAVTPDLAENWLAELRARVAAVHEDRAPSEKMTKFAVVLLNECFPQAANQESRDIARHQFLEAVDGEPSLTDWTFGQVKALLDALTTKDAAGKSVLDEWAAGYVRQTVEAALVEAGQLELPRPGDDDDLPF